MCDSCQRSDVRWKGWREFPDPPASIPAGPWVDLAHVLHDRIGRINFLSAPSFRRVSEMPGKPHNITEMQMVVHIGTHVDAPCHFIIDGPSAEEIPLDRLHGQGVVWKFDAASHSEIGVADLEAARPLMKVGDIVVISTGWARKMGTSAYEDHPSLSVEAAEWLVHRGAKMVCVDFSTPDLSVQHRPKDFRWPVHQVLLSNGVLIAEHLTNLEQLEGCRIEAMFAGIKIEGSDGLPARPMARRIS